MNMEVFSLTQWFFLWLDRPIPSVLVHIRSDLIFFPLLLICQFVQVPSLCTSILKRDLLLIPLGTSTCLNHMTITTQVISQINKWFYLGVTKPRRYQQICSELSMKTSPQYTAVKPRFLQYTLLRREPQCFGQKASRLVSDQNRSFPSGLCNALILCDTGYTDLTANAHQSYC